MRSHPFAVVFLSLLPALASADQPAAGFAAVDLPGGPTYRAVTLSNGSWVGLGNSTVALFAEDGTLLQLLHTFPSSLPPEGIAVDPTESFALVSRSDGTSGGTYRVDLASGTTTFLSFVSAAYFAFESPTDVLVSSTGGFLTYTVSRLDLTSGALQPKLRVPGTFVPIVLDDAGNLYVSFEVSFSPSSYGIVRYDAALLAGPGVVATGDGTVLEEGFEAISGLARSPDGSTFYLAQWFPLSGPDHVLEVRPGSPSSPQVLVQITQPEELLSLQLLPPTPPAAFLPYQLPAGGELHYQTLQGSTWRRKALRPARPTSSVSGPGTAGAGPFELAITGGPPDGTGIVFYGPSSLYNPAETAYLLRVPLFIGLDPVTASRAPGVLTFDPSGNAAQTYPKTSSAVGLWAMQTILFDVGGALVGSSTAGFL